MKREDIVDMTDCPKCGAPRGEKCREPNGAKRKSGASHVERLYKAQDMAAGKPDRVTGQRNPDPFRERRCPICLKLLKTSGGCISHMIDVHGLSREEAKQKRREARAGDPLHIRQRPTDPKSDDDFDVLESF